MQGGRWIDCPCLCANSDDVGADVMGFRVWRLAGSQKVGSVGPLSYTHYIL